MKPKIYEVVLQPHSESNPTDRTIMVVGEWTKTKINTVDVLVEGENIIQMPVKFHQYTLTLGKSICQAEDKFDHDFGKNLAVSRIKHGDSIGSITTNSYSMLTPDACEAILLNKAKYIANHIEKFIKK